MNNPTNILLSFTAVLGMFLSVGAKMFYTQKPRYCLLECDCVFVECLQRNVEWLNGME